jgi:hypothetical protein
MSSGGVAAGLAACGTAPAPSVAPKVNPVVMIIRHAEKPSNQG